MRDPIRTQHWLFRRKVALTLTGGVHKGFWADGLRLLTRIINAGGEREQMERFLTAIVPGHRLGHRRLRGRVFGRNTNRSAGRKSAYSIARRRLDAERCRIWA